VPAQTRAANITAEVARGKRIWEDNNCMGCHTLFGEGAYYAPELTKAVERRGKPWLRLFLKNPEGMYPNDRKMVNYHFNDAQIEDAIAFLYAATEFFGHGIGQPKHHEPCAQYQHPHITRIPSGPACGGAGRA